MSEIIKSNSNSGKRKRERDIDNQRSTKRRAKKQGEDFPVEKKLRDVEDGLPSWDEKSAITKELIDKIDLEHPDQPINSKIAISICKTLARQLAIGEFQAPVASSNSSVPAFVDVTQRLSQFYVSLTYLLKTGSTSTQVTAVRLILQLLKAEADYLSKDIWHSEPFTSLLPAILDSEDGEESGKIYLEEYLQEYHDFCYYSLRVLESRISGSNDASDLENIQLILSSLGTAPADTDDTSNLFGPNVRTKKKVLITARSLKRQAEKTWLALLRSPHLSTSLRKLLLKESTISILPWLSRPETLMDFFTASYDLGGSMSLLALSGLFYLISSKNLDYPSFYSKLYSLLDSDLLHSKHRSRFLRLLDTFLASTHLPASLIASFIKRLSRLSLFAPPAAIVAIVPYIYNLLKSHPTCTFMIHRSPLPPSTKFGDHPDLGTDPFDASETDPQLTHAIESSLWEIETLQSHYHPSVASLARIISEQFTKQRYNLEDFLDHGYATMVATELAKEAKKAPVVEYKIPKRIFTKDILAMDEKEGIKTDESDLVAQLWDFS